MVCRVRSLQPRWRFRPAQLPRSTPRRTPRLTGQARIARVLLLLRGSLRRRRLAVNFLRERVDFLFEPIDFLVEIVNAGSKLLGITAAREERHDKCADDQRPAAKLHFVVGVFLAHISPLSTADLRRRTTGITGRRISDPSTSQRPEATAPVHLVVRHPWRKRGSGARGQTRQQGRDCARTPLPTLYRLRAQGAGDRSNVLQRSGIEYLARVFLIDLDEVDYQARTRQR